MSLLLLLLLQMLLLCLDCCRSLLEMFYAMSMPMKREVQLFQLLCCAAPAVSQGTAAPTTASRCEAAACVSFF
jgi:hypothetical protein